MTALLRTRTTVVWLVMVVATILSYAMGDGIGVSDATVAGIAIIAISLLKFRFILFDFMELRGAPAAMRRTGDIWIALLAVALIGLFVV